MAVLLLLLSIIAAAFGLFLVPSYAFFMIVWMHAPLDDVMLSCTAISLALAGLSWFAARMARRLYKADTTVRGSRCGES